MVTAALFGLVALIQQPQVTAAVDQAAVGVGQTLIVTLEAEAAGADVVELMAQPTFPGFELVSTSQGTVFNAGLGVRTTTWRFTLRALAEGQVTIGPLSVRIAGLPAASGVVSVNVTGSDPVAEARLAARVAGLVSEAPGPDGGDEVVVTVVFSPDTIVLGDQVDLVVVAWFPRDIRSRLRNRPTLVPPELRGAWTYARSSALSVVASREVRGRTYDLFVHHQVVFPLTAGPFEVAPAMVTYNLPVRMSILSREVPQEVQSDPVTITVQPQPLAGRPPGFSGTAARDLELDVLVDSGGFATGDAATVTATLTGSGNVSLWPEPQFAWPAGVRVYSGATDVAVDYGTGVVGGSKIFRYLVVTDSVGTFSIPAASFPYLDLTGGVYRTALAGRARLVARARTLSTVTSEAARPLMARLGQPGPAALLARTDLKWWILLATVPPLLWLAGVGARRFNRRTSISGVGEPGDGLTGLDEAFRRVIAELIPDPSARAGSALVAALRAVGVEEPVADHAARLRGRVDQALYGPDGVPDPDELVAEVRQVLKTLARGTSSRVVLGAGLCVMALAGAAAQAAGQAPSPEQLIEARAYGQAADSFILRAHADPTEAAHWYNLATALDAAGRGPEALAALTRAARIRPRSTMIRDAQARLRTADEATERMTWVSLVTWAESVVIAAACWLVGWTALVLRRGRVVAVAWICGGVALGYGAWLRARYNQPVGLVVVTEAQMRQAPYGSAPSVRSIAVGTGVLIERTEGNWLLVNRGGQLGWIPATQVERL